MDYPRVRSEKEEVISIITRFDSMELRLKFLDWQFKMGIYSKSPEHLSLLTLDYTQFFMHSGTYSKGNAKAILEWVKSIPPRN